MLCSKVNTLFNSVKWRRGLGEKSMATLVRDEAGTVTKLGTADYICQCFLDLVEAKPFYEIKVKELAAHAKISRTTFYTYFDSVFDIAQKLEDDFLEGFYPDGVAFSVFEKEAVADAMDQADYVKRHARVFRLLAGANGDPGFVARFERKVRGMCDAIWEHYGTTYSEVERAFYSSYIAGGTTAITRCIASDPGSFTPEDFVKMPLTIMETINTALGVGRAPGE